MHGSGDHPEVDTCHATVAEGSDGIAASSSCSTQSKARHAATELAQSEACDVAAVSPIRLADTSTEAITDTTDTVTIDTHTAPTSFVEVGADANGCHRLWADEFGDDNFDDVNELDFDTEFSKFAESEVSSTPLFSGHGPVSARADELFNRLRAADDEATCIKIDITKIKRFITAASPPQLEERLHMLVDLASLFEDELQSRVDQTAAESPKVDNDPDGPHQETQGGDQFDGGDGAPVPARSRRRRGGRRQRRPRHEAGGR